MLRRRPKSPDRCFPIRFEPSRGRGCISIPLYSHPVKLLGG